MSRYLGHQKFGSGAIGVGLGDVAVVYGSLFGILEIAMLQVGVDGDAKSSAARRMASRRVCRRVS
ncbi:MAG: hypothetical protein WDO73_04205 [Ignavibacteriota bacterium]